MHTLGVEFTGLPPFKADHGPGPKGARQRQESFNEALQRALAAWRIEYSKEGVLTFPWNPMSGKIALGITYTRVNGVNDPLNIIGGIHRGAKGVCGLPELGFKAEVRSGLSSSCPSGHAVLFPR